MQQSRSLLHRFGALLKTNLFSALDIVIHVHQVADGGNIIGDVGIAMDGVLDGGACHRKVDHIHRLVVVQHGVNQAAGKCIAAAYSSIDINDDGVYWLAEIGISSHLYRMLPYIITLLVLAFTSKKSRAPTAEGIPYDKARR